MPDIGDDMLDLRDLAEELSKLRNERNERMEWESQEPEASEPEFTNDHEALERALEVWRSDEPYFDEEDADKLALLEALELELGGDLTLYPGGQTAIHDDHFEDYARELAKDIGAVQDDMNWPCNSIDWAAAADDLKADYNQVDIGDHTYYIGS